MLTGFLCMEVGESRSTGSGASPKARRQGIEPRERGEFLKLAFMATLKGEGVRGADDAMQQYFEAMNRQGQLAAAKLEEGCAR
jgi:hypothetical protein